MLHLDATLGFVGPHFFESSMGDGQSSKTTARTLEMENLSLNITTNRFSRDLLQRFMGSDTEFEAKEEDERVELNLGLSLGGRFGVDKSSKTLVRSSSIASCLPSIGDDNDAATPARVLHTSLVRTSSLPVETEEEWRKRKELQTLRRMEAKRRRSEKQRNLRIEKEGCGTPSQEIDLSFRDKSLSALPKGKGRYVGQQLSQGSVESRGGSSSTVSDLESKPLPGSSDELSPASSRSLQESGSQDAGSSATKAREDISRTTGTSMESSSKRSDASRTRGREIRGNSMEDMPSVFTKGVGPNGRRVDGILYKYGKGEEVRIMCVCHGTFHSPGEFVKHAGGSDVDHPLKHIVINPNSSSLS